MDAPAVVVCAVLGLVAGWFVVAPVADQFREPLTLEDDEADVDLDDDDEGEVDEDVALGPLTTPARVAVAVATGALWGLDANKFTRWWAVVVYAVVFSAFLAASVVDLRLHRLPDRIVFPALGATFVLVTVASFALTSDTSDALQAVKFALAGLLAYSLILFVFHVVYPAGMGFGDVKLALLMGLSLGWLSGSIGDAILLVTSALFWGCVAGVVFGLAVRFVTRRRGEFAFGPALALGTILVVLTYQP